MTATTEYDQFETRLVCALNAVTDLLQSGLAGVAVDIKDQAAKAFLLSSPNGMPVDDLIEDFEVDFERLMWSFDAESHMTCQIVDVVAWKEAVDGRSVPIFWFPSTAPEGAMLKVPDPWSQTRGGVVPAISTLTDHERLLVHTIEVRNFTLRVPLDSVSRVDLVVDGPDTIISVHAEASIEMRDLYSRTLGAMEVLLSQLPPGGSWKLRWNEPVPDAGLYSWPVLQKRLHATDE